MATTFAAQLRSIAQNSTNTLDLRARRDAHGESLIFEKSVAVKQDWDTIYQICVEGFQELCLLDSRLEEFNQNLFSPYAKAQDRDQLSRKQNEALGVVIEKCLALIGGKLLLRPGVKAVEWLVRRFRVHFYNTGPLLSTFLPYHESPVFRNVLSIIPADKITNEWKFLGPYHKITASVPRHAIVYNATHNEAFFSNFNGYVIRACQEGAGHTLLLRFWGSMTVEAITGRLNQAKSGRREVQKQRQEDILLKVLPLLIDGFEIQDCRELTITCFTIAIVLANSADLEDSVIDSLMGAVAPFLNTSEEESHSALTCLAIIIPQRSIQRVSKQVLQAAMKTKDLDVKLFQLHSQVPVHDLLEALLASSLLALKKRANEAKISFTSSLLKLSPQILNPSAISKLIALLLHQVQQADASEELASNVRVRLIEMLQTLNTMPNLSECFSQAASLAGKSLLEVEGIMGEIVKAPVQPMLLDADTMELESDHLPEKSQTKINTVLGDLPTQPGEESFFEPRSSHYAQFAQAFRTCSRSTAHLKLFEELPLWENEETQFHHLYESFVLRLASSASDASDRAIAISSIIKRVESYSHATCQFLLPHLTVLLSDSAHIVRRATATVMATLQQHLGEDHLEGSSERSEDAEVHDAMALPKTKRVPSRNLAKIIQQAYVPALEECILDSMHVSRILHIALDSTPPSVSNGINVNIELKKQLRHNLFDLLTTYAVACPLWKIRISTVELLDGVQKVGNTATSKVLSPILNAWAAYSEAEATEIVNSEGLSVSKVDQTLVRLVNAQDAEAVERFLVMLDDKHTHIRPALVDAFFDRVGAIWPDMRSSAQVAATTRLFEMSFTKDTLLARGSRKVLQSSSLKTPVLATILEHALVGLTQMQPEGPPKKRIRTSHSRESMSKDLVLDFDPAVSRLTFALEIVDSSKPETHPELLPYLFDLLLTLRRLKEKTTSESPYLLTLCLSSILAIVNQALTTRKSVIDLSSIRADLVIECVRSSDSPQVQTTALLLAASLASVAPDRILHNIMPIFTFMGNSLFSQEDERSVYVTNQAIDQIIPPLVRTLQKQDAKNLISATSSLLSSFVTAYSHVPHHRRVAFYHRLLARLGVDDFAFAVISLLATSHQPYNDLPEFFATLMGGSAAPTQLLTYRKIMDLSQDLFAAKPHNAESLLNVAAKSKTERGSIAQILFATAANLLKSTSLKAQARRLSKFGKTMSEQFQEEYKACIRQVLALMQDQKADHPELVSPTRNCLSALLELPSLAEFLNTVPGLLQELEQSGDQELQVLALRVLASQLQHNAAKDSKTNSEATGFLPTLMTIIKTSGNENYRHAAIVCLDRIVDVYGRKNPDSILEVANVLVQGDHGISSNDARTQVMAVLCLASMMEVLKETAIPIIPPSMSKVLDILRTSTGGSSRNTELHSAAFALLSAFVSHVPFMISDEHVVEIIRFSYESARAKLDVSCTESRKETLSLIAHKLDLDIVTNGLLLALQEVISSSVMDADAISELLIFIHQTIERSSKSSVVKSSDLISTLVLRILDLRRLAQVAESPNNTEEDKRHLTDEDILTVESRLHTLVISFIYKLNDTTFRPVFESWIDWAIKGVDLSEVEDYHSNSASKLARTTSLFNLLTHFFNALKSIVTSYTSYILEPANQVLLETLNSITETSTSHNTIPLYSSTLTLLSTTLAHDADGFFTSPSHFTPLCTNLVSQLTLLSTKTKSKSLRKIIEASVPSTLIALATATIDTPAHHHALNHQLCQLRHNDSAAVRLAAIRLQIALTEDEEVGDEWVNNVVVGTATEGVGGSGETMVYVNESLEDDDEAVEAEVRKWVRIVRERVGEDVFEV
ncbi:hypothetical protein LTR84_001963 [Exophiala bonariae]|uniref:U3 small nucleolar RNA-associated protein 10 n=1 Tax=Exophiala bonariae TaxID=1690606 RepID=A0AAV9NC13_9EURO|nr:hypothetical protein LTR84_001963 [Exophiala bonariae]